MWVMWSTAQGVRRAHGDDRRAAGVGGGGAVTRPGVDATTADYRGEVRINLPAGGLVWAGVRAGLTVTAVW